MKNDFCAFILTNGRPNKVTTYNTLRKFGYTGPIRLIVDNEDDGVSEYVKLYGDEVVVFDKTTAAKKMDVGDNFEKRNSVVYARNVVHEIAKDIGVEYFIQLDDDYNNFHYRFNSNREYSFKQIMDLDGVFDSLINFLSMTTMLTVAMSQGGDFPGGEYGNAATALKMKRKAMNTFVCKTDRPFSFLSRMNDDVTTYVLQGYRGQLFSSILQASVSQAQTQANAGGLTDMYLEYGTYTKSFYTVMYAPSMVKVGLNGDLYKRLHHQINWENCAPKIIRETCRKHRQESIGPVEFAEVNLESDR